MSSFAITFTMSPAYPGSATPEMPMIPVSSKTLWNAVQFWARAYGPAPTRMRCLTRFRFRAEGCGFKDRVADSGFGFYRVTGL